MAKKNKRPFTTDELLNMARRCDQGECSGRCPFYGKDNCKDILLKKVYKRLHAYYSVVGELDGGWK